ncbi:MAG: trehalose-6-phosphate synthase, partial [Candidatus Altiarchaeota archaeon]|nr:trehalose-6-phosphate synthase [Candidatus Altiarchaeota archaeon]
MKKEDLAKLVKSKIGDSLFVVVSNREPYMHLREEETIHCVRPASGMAVALDSVMKACGGVWIAHGSGNADMDVVDERDGLMVPEDNPKYRLRRVWMNKEEEEGYYDITSNEMFWPLCHTVYVRPRFDEDSWKKYRTINERFVTAILEEIGNKKAFIWFQDFHLSLAP